jgi:hypothetical protein
VEIPSEELEERFDLSLSINLWSQTRFLRFMEVLTCIKKGLIAIMDIFTIIMPDNIKYIFYVQIEKGVA